jgi:hypothetical protein
MLGAAVAQSDQNRWMLVAGDVLGGRSRIRDRPQPKRDGFVQRDRAPVAEIGGLFGHNALMIA